MAKAFRICHLFLVDSNDDAPDCLASTVGSPIDLDSHEDTYSLPTI